LLLQDCWAENPANRPNATQIVERLLSPGIGAQEKQLSADWNDTFSAKFRRSVQDFTLTPSVTTIEQIIFGDGVFNFSWFIQLINQQALGFDS
jgi:negative regulator of sigma E activity